MNWKSFTSHIKAIDDKGTGSAVFATLEVKDLDGDVIRRNAIGIQRVKIAPAHDWRAPNIGFGTTREQGDLAIVDFTLNLAMSSGREWYEALKNNFSNQVVQEWSFGYDVKSSDQGTFNGERVRFLQSLLLFEASPVMKGAGIDTRLTTMKDYDGTTGNDRGADAALAHEHGRFLRNQAALAGLGGIDKWKNG